MVRDEGPITGEELASRLNVTRAALRPDLAILTMIGMIEAKPRVGYSYGGKTLEPMASEKLRRIKARDIASVPVVISEKALCYDAAVTLFLENVDTLPVVNNQNLLVGIVSRGDFLRQAMSGAAFDKVPVGVIMTRVPNVYTIGADDSAVQAVRLLVAHNIGLVPVVRMAERPEDQSIGMEVVGTISRQNVARFFLDVAEGK
jgi:CBS domain-containing protein